MKENSDTVIIRSGPVVIDWALLAIFAIGAVATWAASPHLPSFIPIILLAAIPAWLFFSRKRLFGGEPYLKLTPSGFVDSRLGDDMVLSWTRISDVELRTRTVRQIEGKRAAYFLTFMLERSHSEQSPKVDERLCAYIQACNESAELIGVKCTEYPVKVLVCLSMYPAMPQSIVDMMDMRAQAGKQAQSAAR